MPRSGEASWILVVCICFASQVADHNYRQLICCFENIYLARKFVLTASIQESRPTNER